MLSGESMRQGSSCQVCYLIGCAVGVKLNITILDIKDILLRKPPPSDYAKVKNWAVLQKLPSPMLCMRPVKCRGPPIFLLHRVFAKYLSLSKEALPATPEARIALHVARALCNTMGNYFDDQNARRDAFLQL
jgi:hypothetical protein